MTITESHARKLWIPFNGFRWPPPRLLQLMQLYICRHDRHKWSQWRVETEDWFEYVDQPVDYAMRVCQRGCGTIQRYREGP